MSARSGIPVHELLDRYTSAEITELIAFDRLEPSGNAIENHRAAMLAYTTVCVNSTDEHKPPEYGDFLKAWFGDPVAEPVDPEDAMRAQEKQNAELAKAQVAMAGGMFPAEG